MLLAVAAALVIAGSFLTTAKSTETLTGGTTFSNTKSTVNVTTFTDWSMSSDVLGDYASKPLGGWADLAAGLCAVGVAVLLVLFGRRSFARPLAALAAGVLAAVVLVAVLGFAELMNTATADKDMTLDVAAGPAVWLQIPAGLLAIVVAVLALRPPYGYMASQIAT